MERINLITTILAIVLVCLMIIFVLDTGENDEDFFSLSAMVEKFFICGLIIAIGSFYFTEKFLKTEKIIFDIESQPILETNEATDGVPFAGNGIIDVAADNVLSSPYGEIACVYYHSIKEESVFNTWVTIENLASFVPFYIKDSRGKLRVDLTNMDNDFSEYKIEPINKNVPNPKNSEIECDVLLWKSFYSEKSRDLSGTTKTAVFRRSEFVLRPGTKVFTYGMVSKRRGELWLHEEDGYPLIISKKDPKEYVAEFYKGGSLVYISHFLAAGGYTISLISINHFLELNLFFVLIFLLAGNLIILGSALFSLYNRIVSLRNRALNAISNINVELKRRRDLIPSLVKTVKEYTEHEKRIQQIVTEARAEIIFSKESIVEKKPIIPSLAAVIEDYSNLKADKNFQFLMEALVDTEERIAYSREFYNRTVRKYNTIIRQFPFILVSAPFKMREMNFISIARGEKTIP